MTPAVMARILPRPVFNGIEQIREEITLDRLADLTAVHGPREAATILFGGTP